jgi:hypothetical protein
VSGSRILLGSILAVAMGAGCQSSSSNNPDASSVPAGDAQTLADAGGPDASQNSSPDGGTLSDAGTSSDAGGLPPAFSQFCASYAKAYCAYLTQCGLWDPSSVTQCTGYTGLNNCIIPWGASVRYGSGTFDPLAATTCLSLLGSAGCNSSLIDECSLVVRANALTGQPCYAQTDCVIPTDQCVGTPCGMTCQSQSGQHGDAGVGQACVADSSCQSGLFCDQATYLCTAPQPAGSPCAWPSTNECDSFSYCSGSTMKCVALPTVGQSCSLAPSCAPGAYCSGGSCVAEPTLGQSCTNAIPCVAGAYCGPTSQCQAQTGDGGSCALNGYGMCESGLTCNTFRLQCLPPQGNGGPCGVANDCQENFACDPVTQTCAVLTTSVAGEPCNPSSATCVPQSVCVGGTAASDAGPAANGTCTATQIGSPCKQSGQCPWGSSCTPTDGGSGTETCVTSTLGSPCLGDNNCPSTAWCDVNTLKCAPRIAVGQACSQVSSCQGPAQCLPPNPYTCTQSPGLGATCSATLNCLPPNVCSVGYTCAPQYSWWGTACVSDATCGIGSCVNGSCVPFAPIGTACNANGYCASGLCVSNVCVAACR